jgi:hypothetical protein
MKTAGSSLDYFLGGVRRRSVALSLLAGAFVATAVNEIFRWTAIGGFLFWKLRVPVLDIGPLLFLILVPYLLRRWTPAASARLADARLGLDDRLASFVDFRGRGDVPAEVRAAQEQDTERALAGMPPAAAVPIRGWLAAGPLLLAASIAYPYFIFTTTETVTMRMTRLLFEGVRIAGDGAPSGLQTARNEQRPGESVGEKERGGGKSVEGGNEGERKEPEAVKAPAAEESPGKQQGEGEKSGQPAEEAGQRAREPSREPPGDGKGVEPEQLVSERVGARLADVVDPVYAPSASARPQEAAAGGTIEIDLVPRGRSGRGRGDAPGRTVAPERVAVNLDALPEQYRPLVKAYFELLAAGGQGGDTTTTRSGAP